MQNNSRSEYYVQSSNINESTEFLEFYRIIRRTVIKDRRFFRAR